MGAEAAIQLPAVVLVPFPAQGHVTPMLHLARALAVHGVAATVAVPDFIHRRIAEKVEADVGDGGGVTLASIPSGVADGGGDPPGFAEFGHAMEHHMPAHLERLLTRATAGTGCRVACVVIDVLASWAVPVAERCGVPAAGFWPAMLASYYVVAAIPELLEKGLISESGTPRSWPNQSENDEVGGQDQMIRALKILPAHVDLKDEEVPWLVGDSATQKSRFAFWLQALHRARSFRSVLVNSFPGEAGGAAATDEDGYGHPAARQSPRVFPVGPLLACDTVIERSTKGDGDGPCSKQSSMWQADSTCIGWLDRQRGGSVVYVSFGSWVGPIGADKIRELALGLEATGRPFLWALKKDPSWRAGLPDGFAERVSVAGGGRGKVVDWAPQEDVLRHGAVGCYLTHCGWNSTVEAIRHGVRLLCCPVSGDQFINCAYITGVWEIGVKLGGMSRDQVRECIERIMDGKEGRHLQEKMNVLRKNVVTAEARSLAQRNVKSFVNEINKDYPLVMQMYSIL